MADNSAHQPHSDTGHDHGAHGHTHGVVDPTIMTTGRGIWAVKWSFLALGLTALLQFGIAVVTGSVALLADTVHNIGDAATAVPLWIAFLLARRRPSPRFTYGLGRAEDLAGIVVVLIIAFSAVYAAYESVYRLFNPQPIDFLWAVALAALIGFLGNEGVAIFRIRVGKEINSAALIADGYHARADGFTSLAVLLGAIGVWLGFPLADPIVGLLISAAIVKIVWDSAKAVFVRALDGVDPEVIDEVRHAIGHTPGVEEITDVRARWLGHRLLAEINISVAPEITIERAHEIAVAARANLMEHITYLANAVIHVDPATASGEAHHHAHAEHHEHDHEHEHEHGLPAPRPQRGAILSIT